jgi:lysophospholipase L1-like esterase
MKRLLFSMMACFLLSLPSFSQEPLRVACVGDSITYGDKIFFRSFRSYPTVLQKISNGRLITGNFGVNAKTALDVPDRAWTDTSACGSALLFQPDVVVIMLGINDLFFSELYPRYPEALRSIVERFQALPTSPRLFLCTLTPLAPAEQQQPINRTIRTVFNPAIRRVAAETGAQLIDIHSIYPATLEFLPDGVHPSSDGAALIAQTVFEALNRTAASTPEIHSAPISGTVDLSIRNEAIAAQDRATRWLATQSDSNALPEPAGRWGVPLPQSPEEMPDLLPLLEGGAPPDGENPYFAMAAMAIALNQMGQETVFLAADRPIRWREALLHQLVQSQKIDARGQGYWTVPGAADPSAEAFCSTTYALQTLQALLGD